MGSSFLITRWHKHCDYAITKAEQSLPGVSLIKKIDFLGNGAWAVELLFGKYIIDINADRAFLECRVFLLEEFKENGHPINIFGYIPLLNDSFVMDSNDNIKTIFNLLAKYKEAIFDKNNELFSNIEHKEPFDNQESAILRRIKKAEDSCLYARGKLEELNRRFEDADNDNKIFRLYHVIVYGENSSWEVYFACDKKRYYNIILMSENNYLSVSISIMSDTKLKKTGIESNYPELLNLEDTKENIDFIIDFIAKTNF